MTPSDAAFEAIVAQYRVPLVKYAAAIVGRDYADDVVQDSFVSAHSALQRGDDVANLGPWLYRIVRNKALNVVRDRGPTGVPLDERHAALDTPDMVTERRQTLRKVVDAVHALPRKQRDAIVLRELEGRSYDEIAGQLGVSDPAVRGLLNRARMTLRRAAAALTPVWPSRLAELWSAGTIGGSGATRACATGLVAAVATFGGLPNATKPEEKEKTTMTAAAPTTTSARAISSQSSPVREDEVAPQQPTVREKPAAIQNVEAPAPGDEEPAPTLEPEPKSEPAPQHRERREQYEQYEQYAPPPEQQPAGPRMETTQREPSPDDGFHKTNVGSFEGDAPHREFSR